MNVDYCGAENVVVSRNCLFRPNNWSKKGPKKICIHPILKKRLWNHEKKKEKTKHHH